MWPPTFEDWNGDPNLLQTSNHPSDQTPCINCPILSHSHPKHEKTAQRWTGKWKVTTVLAFKFHLSRSANKAKLCFHALALLQAFMADAKVTTSSAAMGWNFPFAGGEAHRSRYDLQGIPGFFFAGTSCIACENRFHDMPTISSTLFFLVISSRSSCLTGGCLFKSQV